MHINASNLPFTACAPSYSFTNTYRGAVSSALPLRLIGEWIEPAVTVPSWPSAREEDRRRNSVRVRVRELCKSGLFWSDDDQSPLADNSVNHCSINQAAPRARLDATQMKGIFCRDQLVRWLSVGLGSGSRSGEEWTHNYATTYIAQQHSTHYFGWHKRRLPLWAGRNPDVESDKRVTIAKAKVTQTFVVDLRLRHGKFWNWNVSKLISRLSLCNLLGSSDVGTLAERTLVTVEKCSAY